MYQSTAHCASAPRKIIIPLEAPQSIFDHDIAQHEEYLEEFFNQIYDKYKGKKIDRILIHFPCERETGSNKDNLTWIELSHNDNMFDEEYIDYTFGTWDG